MLAGGEKVDVLSQEAMVVACSVMVSILWPPVDVGIGPAVIAPVCVAGQTVV